jgi:hypothetical protein
MDEWMIVGKRNSILSSSLSNHVVIPMGEKGAGG